MTVIIIIAIVASQLSYQQLAREERAILEELYESTNGDGWTKRDGWRSARPICEWYGVWCDYIDADERKPVVMGLQLAANGLRGRLPGRLSDLKHLKTLNLAGNTLTGAVPEPLLDRWDRHALELDLRDNAFTNLVTGVSVGHFPSGTLCSPYHFSFEVGSGGKTVFQSVRCADPGRSRRTFCLVREGTIRSLERFSRALVQLGARKFQPEYSYPFTFTTHDVTVTTTAEWGDGTKTVVETYGRQGPLNVWMAQQLFLSLIADVGWEKEYRRARCASQR